jgi:hypothetical protein
MKAVYRNVVHTVLCTGLLLSAGVVASAQEPSTQQASPAPDNTKVNERDRSQISKRTIVLIATSRNRFENPS